jgi:hypothetical protein
VGSSAPATTVRRVRGGKDESMSLRRPWGVSLEPQTKRRVVGRSALTLMADEGGDGGARPAIVRRRCAWSSSLCVCHGEAGGVVAQAWPEAAAGGRRYPARSWTRSWHGVTGSGASRLMGGRGCSGAAVDGENPST